MIRSTGLAGVAEAAARIGWTGFAVYCFYSLALFGILGGAWLAAAPGERRASLPLFAWARLVRESVSDLLPFAQLGGVVIGARVLLAGGVPARRTYASLIVDMTTEMASQLAFTLAGLAIVASVLAGAQGAAVRPLVIGGTGVMAAVMAAFFLGQRRAIGLAGALARRVLPDVADGLGEVQTELARIYADRRAVLLSLLLNLLGWLGTAGAAWLLLRLIGRPIAFSSALAIESLIATVRSVAFAVPGAIGFQEAAYALIGPLFGLPAEIALALSLGKRARDLALGLPTLLAWQLGEAHALFLSRPPPRE